ncbi:MAG: hypothetical protein KCHDKBKB_02407 [Elusimicrobia bacterium]|nr:hypothetical protein [Elusimicrobiota bacterium]
MKHKLPAFFSLILTLTLFAPPRFGTANISVGYTPEKAGFTVSYRGEISPFKITPMFVLPKEEIKLIIGAAKDRGPFVVESVKGEWKASSATEWSWVAPSKAGFTSAKVTELSSGETMTLNIFVMIPYGKIQNGKLNGYKIGQYPKVAPSKKTVYSLPRGFIEVTSENKHVQVSPHFTLGQFLCKQPSSKSPKYLVLRERLVLKLEHLLEHVNREGLAARTFSVMSGYRTPAYNKSLGNVRLSRHMWGDAADVYINNNEPHSLSMEDLNGDGREDAQDAELLFQVMEKWNNKPATKAFVGGLGWYKPTKSHGPFVHVDARGTSAKWSSN